MPPRVENEDFLRKLDEGISSAGVQFTDSIVCAVSGGPDSTALLLGLKRLEHRFRSLEAAHYNHRARGDESDLDEAFVRRLCADNGIPVRIGRSDRQTGHLDEKTAREDRYAFLASVADEKSADTMAVAHTVEDQVETVLFRLARGSGVRGARGMRPNRILKTPTDRTINLVRPMLNTTHRDAQRFLCSEGITARHDSSNDDWEAYARNRIRHRVIPELETINPNVVAAIARFAEIMHLNVDHIRRLAGQTMGRASTEYQNTFLRKPIASSHPVIANEVLSTMYRAIANAQTQLDQHHTDKLLDLISTGRSAAFHLPRGITFWTNHEYLGMTRNDVRSEDAVPYPKPIQNPIQLPTPGKVDLGDGYSISAEVSPLPTNYRRANDGEAWLRLDLFQSKRLSIRNRQHSDRFNPLGMNQDVDLSKFLINSKIAAPWRDRIPVVADSDDRRIIWLPGIRIAEWAKVESTDTNALHLRFHRELEDQEPR